MAQSSMPFFNHPAVRLAVSAVKALLRGVGKVQSWLILSIVYACAFGLSAIVLRLFRVDLLNKRPCAAASFWSPQPGEAMDLEEARQPF